jgi:uncharacterized lipoprotein YajG
MWKPGNLRNVMNNSATTFVLLPIALLLLGGCATPRAPLNYSPSSVSTAAGAVTVTEFKYLPADAGKVEPYQIRNTALGNLMFDQNIGVFFRDAVFKEMRFVGVKMDGKTRILTGEIEEFLIDDLGHNVDWTLKVRYVVKNSENGDILYDSRKTTQRRTAKFVNVSGALNETIKLNIEEVIKDESFIKTID